jgi:ribosomal protein L11 methyltransferase
VTTRKALIEISLSGLEDEVIPSVIHLFDRWGRGGAIVEQIAGENARSTVKTYLLPEDDEGLRQIEIGLTLLNQAVSSQRVGANPCGCPPGQVHPQVPSGEDLPLPQDIEKIHQARNISSSGDSPDSQRLPTPQIRFLAEADWAEAWKSGYDVLHIGRRLVVRPTWRDYTPEPGDLVIALDPGMAFGSGLHPTTRLCLEALEDHMRPGASVLDVGTGSGILAIAAARLGASRVLALDTDPLAVRVARENVALNQVESVVRVEVGTVQISNLPWPTRQPVLPAPCRDGAPVGAAPWPAWRSQDGQVAGPGGRQSPVWDLVVANILAETIIDLEPALAANLSPGGILVVSGIIAERTDAVLASLHQNGLALVERRDDGDWVALIGYKPDGRRMTKDG